MSDLWGNRLVICRVPNEEVKKGPSTFDPTKGLVTTAKRGHGELVALEVVGNAVVDAECNLRIGYGDLVYVRSDHMLEISKKAVEIDGLSCLLVPLDQVSVMKIR